MANVIIDDAWASALLDSGATVDLMAYNYTIARGFDINPIIDLTDQEVTISLVVTLHVATLSTTSRSQESLSITMTG